MKKTTKISIIIGAIALSALVPMRSSSQLAPEQEQLRRQPSHQVVALWAYQTGMGVTDLRGYTYQYLGSDIYCSSSSRGAPQFPQATVPAQNSLTNLADGLALLLDQGFKITTQGEGTYGQFYLLVK